MSERITCFGTREHKDLHSGGVTISGNPFFRTANQHGDWMAQALKKIAPGCKIYSINDLSGIGFNGRANNVKSAGYGYMPRA